VRTNPTGHPRGNGAPIIGNVTSRGEQRTPVGFSWLASLAARRGADVVSGPVAFAEREGADLGLRTRPIRIRVSPLRR